MATKKTKKAAAPQEVARFDLGNGMVLVKFDDNEIKDNLGDTLSNNINLKKRK